MYSQKPWIKSLTHFWVWETNPPLHILLLKIWFIFFHPTELTARLPSLFMAIGSVWVLYNLTQRWFEKSTALVTSALLTLAPLHILYSATARTYSLLILLEIVVVDYFSRIFLEHDQKKSTAFLYCLSTTLLLYSHLTSLALVTIEILILWVHNRSNLKKYLALTAYPIALWLVWAIPSLSMKLTGSTFSNGWFFNVTHNASQLFKITTLFFFGPGWSPHWQLILSIILLALLIKNATHTMRTGGNIYFATTVFFAVIPFVSALALGLWEPKFIFITLPWFVVWGAYIIVHSRHPRLYTVLSLVLLIPGILTLFRNFPLNNWHAVNNLLPNNATSTILLYDNFTNKNEIDRYIQVPYQTVAYIPTSTQSWDKFLITQNYRRLVSSSSTIQAWLATIPIERYRNVILMQYPENAFMHVAIARELEKIGYTRTSEQVLPLLNTPYLYTYEKK